jgi:hypothetical protein
MSYLTLRRDEGPSRRVSWDFFSSLLERDRSPPPRGEGLGVGFWRECRPELKHAANIRFH